MTAVAQPIGQIGNHALDPAVMLRWHANEGIH